MKVKLSSCTAVMYGISIYIYVIMQSSIPKMNDWLMQVLKILLIGTIIYNIIFEFIKKEKISMKTLSIFCSIAIIFMINYFNSQNDTELLFIIIFMFLCRSIETSSVFKAYYIGAFLAVFTVLFSWNIGLIENTIDSSGRNYIGFLFPTFGPNIFLTAVLAYVASKEDKVSNYFWCVIVLINIWFKIMTDTIAVFLSIFLIMILYIIIQSTNIRKFIVNNKIIKNIFIYCAFIFAIATIIFQVFFNSSGYNNKFLIELDQLLNYRLSLGRNAFERYNVTLFGQKIIWNTGNSKGEYFYVDSSYIYILLTYGVITLVMSCFIMAIIQKYAIQQKKYNLIIALLVFLIHCITDPQFISFRNNPFIITVIFAYLVISNSKIKSMKGE